MSGAACLPGESHDTRGFWLDLFDEATYWPCYDVADGAMKHVNAYFLFGLGLFMDDLLARLKVPEQHGFASFSAIHRAATMRQFLNGDFIPLNGSSERQLRAAAESLLHALDAIGRYANDLTRPLNDVRIERHERDACEQAYERFRRTLELDAGRLSLYFVPQRLAYDTHTLLENAELAIPGRVRKVMPAAAIADFKQAGRCVAYAQPTAAGFHALRSAESMIREYLRELNGTPPLKPTWGHYIGAIQRCPDYSRYVIGRIEQLKVLERDELFHVERARLLTKAEGEEIFGYALGTIQAIGLHIAERRGILPDADDE